MTDRENSGAQGGGESAEMVTLQVTVRREHARLLRGFAAREGASVEALASLWLEEKLDEAMRSSGASTAGPGSGSE